MKFRYIIIGWELFDGPFGTNDIKVAQKYASWEMYSVVDVETGKDISLQDDQDIKEPSDPFQQDEADEQADPDDEATPGRTVHPSLIPDPDEDTPFDER